MNMLENALVDLMLYMNEIALVKNMKKMLQKFYDERELGDLLQILGLGREKRKITHRFVGNKKK